MLIEMAYSANSLLGLAASDCLMIWMVKSRKAALSMSWVRSIGPIGEQMLQPRPALAHTVRDHRDAGGLRAKTDKLDASLIARFAHAAAQGLRALSVRGEVRK